MNSGRQTVIEGIFIGALTVTAIVTVRASVLYGNYYDSLKSLESLSSIDFNLSGRYLPAAEAVKNSCINLGKAMRK